MAVVFMALLSRVNGSRATSPGAVPGGCSQLEWQLAAGRPARWITLDSAIFRSPTFAIGPGFRSFPRLSAIVRSDRCEALRPPEQKVSGSNPPGRTKSLGNTGGFLGLRILQGSRSGNNVAVSRGCVGVSAPFRDFPLAQALERDLWLFEADALCSGRVDRGDAGADLLSRLGQREGGKILTHLGQPTEPPRPAPARSREQLDFA
jgi:hypothetical protein